MARESLGQRKYLPIEILRNHVRIHGNVGHIGLMCESFGLDRKIEQYKGKRPITLFRWDLECLLAVIELALRNSREYPSQSTRGFIALKSLGDRLSKEYQAVYGEK